VWSSYGKSIGELEQNLTHHFNILYGKWLLLYRGSILFVVCVGLPSGPLKDEVKSRLKSAEEADGRSQMFRIVAQQPDNGWHMLACVWDCTPQQLEETLEKAMSWYVTFRK